MGSTTTPRLAVIVGAIWPFLAFAALQAAVLLTLGLGLGLLRKQALPPDVPLPVGAETAASKAAS